MENQSFYYKPSMKVDNLRTLLSYSTIIAISLLLGYVYTVVTITMPIIYMNFLLTVGFGFVLAFINKFLIRFSHNRNRKSQIIQAIITGGIANYFQWTVYILYAYNGEVPSFSDYLSYLHWIIIPQNFINAIVEINKVGLWSIFGITFNGFILAIIWLIEAFLIIIIPIIAILKSEIYPYSELLKRWYPKYTLFIDFETISLVNQFIENLKEDVYSTLEKLGKGDGLRHSKIHIYYLKDERKQYLKVENIYVENRGQRKKNISVIVNNFKLDNQTAELIVNKFENKKVRFDLI